ncbi:3-deoxy-D-manno-octulosonic acid transferase [Marinomonas sp. 2405UD68-3]|uniref:3-deoxy-D-manno-octulosonic acid transferase n=1 Tax=Marinomonas sp. 2405UD68-3 TaxID=3391835 RepID=UPI0039C8D3A1
MWVYQLLLKALTPWILRKLKRFDQAYDNYSISQAMGEVDEDIHADLWIHCASVGEVLAVRPLVSRWQATNPEKHLLITTMTPTGAAQVVSLFKVNVQHHYLPIDWDKSVVNFLAKLTCPKLLIVETELWPNLLNRCQQKGIDVHIINARLSERSLRKYTKFPSLSKKLMQLPTQFCAHDETDARRFRTLGADSVCVTGNIKFDLTVPDSVLESDWRQRIGKCLPIWIGASTHEGEEPLLLEAHKAIQKMFNNALLLLVPRHPERFELVYELAKAHFDRVAKRSEMTIEDWSQYDVVIGDSMGELLYYYQCSDVVFVGGSLIERGGHNPIEPALLAKPILVGEHTFNFKEITQDLIKIDAAWRCLTVADIERSTKQLFENETLCFLMGEKSMSYAKNNQGAVERVLHSVGEALN